MGGVDISQLGPAQHAKGFCEDKDRRQRAPVGSLHRHRHNRDVLLGCGFVVEPSIRLSVLNIRAARETDGRSATLRGTDGDRGIRDTGDYDRIRSEVPVRPVPPFRTLLDRIDSVHRRRSVR